MRGWTPDDLRTRIEKLLRWADENPGRLEALRSQAAIVVGLVLMVLGSQIGRAPLHLILDGAKTQGRIIDFQTYRSPVRSVHDSAFMPIVEFQAGNQVFRFRDWKGTNIVSFAEATVSVLYDPANPSIAMVDRPYWRWVPWGPMFVAGLVLVLASIRNWRSQPAAEAHR